ncbi:MAG TPA: hypothetical protein VFV99_02730 [Kofleriaceae bacterium]|nr:hypothetical protein [Kofleriaceae bacterium]
MIRRHVLAALAAGVEAGDDEAAREVLRGTDWVLRAPAQRELSRALIDAALLSGEFGASDRESVRHIHRVAALNLAKRFEVDVSNREDVAAAYATLNAAPPARAPIATIFAGSAVALGVLLLVWLAVAIRRPSHPARPIPPLVTGAYFYGGTPARDEALEQYVVNELTDLVIETDAERGGSHDGAPRAKHAAELRNSSVIASRGPALAAAWRALIDTFDHWVDVRVRGKEFRSVESELGRRAQAVSDQFAALGLGLYLQSDVMLDNGVAHAAIFVFAVEEVVYVRAGGEPRRVLSLRRLDELNLRHTLLGRQGDELGDPVVLLDQIDEFVNARVLPTLQGDVYPVGDEAWRSTIYGRGIAYRAGEAIRTELLAAVGTGSIEELRPKVARIIAASVRRHEARHGIDNERSTPLRFPRQLAAYVDNDGGPMALRARAELAGYLSQIGNEPVTPQFALWNLASLTFNRTRWQSAEFYAGVVVIEGLARELGIGDGPTVKRGQFDRQRLVALAEPLAAQSSDKLRAAARNLWIELYGEPMLPIIDVAR